MTAWFAASLPAQAAYLPDDRRIEWEAGVEGGIPVRTTVFANVKNAPYNAKGDGVTDDTTAIKSAISACPQGQVVFLPAGTYRISSALRIPSGITVRGAGMGQTIIKGASTHRDDWLVGFENTNWDYDFNARPSFNLLGSTAKGTTTIETSSAHGWSVGDIILVDQLESPGGSPMVTNDGLDGACSWCGRNNGNRPLGQWTRVTGVPSSSRATIHPPLYFNYQASLTPQAVQATGLTTYAGVEDLTIDNFSSQARDTCYMHFAANCWFLRVDMAGSYRRMIWAFGGFRNTIKECIIHSGVPEDPIGSNYDNNRAYGLFLGYGGSGWLVEDNIFHTLMLPIAFEGGCSGNVIAYNYFTNLRYADNEWGRQAIGFHGAHPMMNLIEGNHSVGRISGDFYWGSSSHQTIFRNRMEQDPQKVFGNWGIDLYKGNQFYNVVGNILGTVGVETIFQIDGSQNFPYDYSRSIYRLGYVNASSNGSGSFSDPNVKATLFRHANWDSVNRSVQYLSGYDQTLPASLYYSSKPSWWGDLDWPPYGPGLDANNQIPAEMRYGFLQGAEFPTVPQNLNVSILP